MAPRLTNANLHYMPQEWTDHSMLTIDILPARQDHGRGTWRFNPTLLHDEDFVNLLDHTIAAFFNNIEF
ncbi:hypothetical protein K492DRAFT_138974, partial [Lichtheimia hyalospora FSU 10163]